MNTKPFYSILFLLLVAASCRKGNVATPLPAPAPTPVPVVNMLSKVEFPNGDYDSVYYNANLQVIQLKKHNNAVVPVDKYFTFEYDAAGKITRISERSGEYYEYKYVSGELTAVMHYVGNRKEDYRLYDYLNGKLTGIEEYYLEEQSGPGYLLRSETELSYYPDGNLKKETVYAFEPQTHKRFAKYSSAYSDYDGKANTIAFLERSLYLSQVTLYTHHPGKMIWTDEVSGDPLEYTYSYTYDDFSHPLTRTTLIGGVPLIQKFYYY